MIKTEGRLRISHHCLHYNYEMMQKPHVALVGAFSAERSGKRYEDV
jgi:hypothetical protein